jgi:hypothetical protein
MKPVNQNHRLARTINCVMNLNTRRIEIVGNRMHGGKDERSDSQRKGQCFISSL